MPAADRPVIAHVLHRLYLAGAEVLAAALSRELRQRYDFVFLCLDEIGPLGEELAAEGFPVIDLSRQPGVDLAVARRIRQAVREHGIDLLHAHQYTPFFYASLARGLGRRPPVLFTEHGRHYPDQRRPKRVLANRFLLRRQDRVTAVGQFIKQALVDNEAIPAHRIEVIHNGIDPGRFGLAPPAAAEARRRLRAQFGLSDQTPVALQVARFHPVKDHPTALRAMAHVVKVCPEAMLLLVGDGEGRQAAQTLAEELGLMQNLRFLGVRQDVPELMAAADLFVLSSLSEGISVTLLEAMGAGLPIVATDVGGNPEVVAHGQTGLLSPRGDAPALGRNMATLLQDQAQRRQMGQAGRQRLLDQFTQQAMHAGFERLYGSILGIAPPYRSGD